VGTSAGHRACAAGQARLTNQRRLTVSAALASVSTSHPNWLICTPYLSQPPIVDRDAFDRVQEIVAARAHAPAMHKPHRSRRPYALRGCVRCGVCERRMQGHWVNDVPYYRCRFPAEYALANRVQHPVNVYLRENLVIGEVDQWLARELAPHRMNETLRALTEAHQSDAPHKNEDDGTAGKIAECDRKLAQYRAALDAGANPATVAGWIAETEAEKASYALVMRRSDQPRARMTEQEIKAVVDKLADIARVLSQADPNDKSEIFRQLGLKLTYHPGRRIVEAKIELAPHGFFESVRGGT